MLSSIISAATISLVAWTVSSAATLAAEPAHEHGVGVLNVALEADKLSIELEVPGADIVGFEHVPNTDQDKQKVRDAVVSLKDGLALFQPSAEAACRLENAEVRSELVEHDTERGHEKEHGHKDDDHDQRPHAEFQVRYQFVCGSPGRLTRLDLTYFKTFANARELDARIITARGQSVQELTPASPRLRF